MSLDLLTGYGCNPFNSTWYTTEGENMYLYCMEYAPYLKRQFWKKGKGHISLAYKKWQQMGANGISGKPNAPTSDNLREQVVDLLLELLTIYINQDWKQVGSHKKHNYTDTYNQHPGS